MNWLSNSKFEISIVVQKPFVKLPLSQGQGRLFARWYDYQSGITIARECFRQVRRAELPCMDMHVYKQTNV